MPFSIIQIVALIPIVQKLRSLFDGPKKVRKIGELFDSSIVKFELRFDRRLR
jgi:hypothetical protein